MIPAPDNFTAEKCATTFDTHVIPSIGYSDYIVFDLKTLFMSSHFYSWAAGKGIELEPSTTYYSQTDGESEIVNKEIIQITKACEGEGNK